jgi:glycosyltransferase involved in cell wall biosynthesis
LIHVLYLHPAHAFGGASKSLIELFKAFPEGSVQATVICPRGNVAEQFRSAGMKVVECTGLSQWDNTRYGYYRGIRWVIFLRELWFLLPTLVVIYRTLRRNSFDLIHANEITLLPAALYAKWLSAMPLVVHVRSLQRRPDEGFLTRLVNRMLLRLNAVIAIDQTVARTLPAEMSVTVIHNGIQAPQQVEHTMIDRPLRIAMVGGLLRMKGVYEFVEAARICRDRGLNVEFLLAGENPRQLKGVRKWLFARLGFAHDVRADLEQYIREHELGNVVKLLGFVLDVQSLYRNVDILCFPSHLDAAGRPVFEAGFYGVPSLVAARDPEPDTIVDGETGLCIAAKDQKAIADAVEYLYKNPDERCRLGENSRRLAHKNFNIGNNAQQLLGVYQSVIATAMNHQACDKHKGYR